MNAPEPELEMPRLLLRRPRIEDFDSWAELIAYAETAGFQTREEWHASRPSRNIQE